MADRGTGDTPANRRDQGQTSPADHSQPAPDAAAESEAINNAVELLKPLLRDPGEAPQAIARLAAVTEMFRGPLPHPSHLQAYDRILPGSSHEILEMAKREQAHRHTAQRLEMLYPYLGLAAGFLGFLACIGGGILLALNDHDAVAGGMLGVPSLGVIGWFIIRACRMPKRDPTTGPNPDNYPEHESLFGADSSTERLYLVV